MILILFNKKPKIENIDMNSIPINAVSEFF